MNGQNNGQSGYYQTIAREFLRRRGAPLLLSPKDQAVIAAWEEKRVPLDVVLEGIGRTFDGLRVKGRGTRGLSLAFCERQVEGALAQCRDRSAGRKSSLPPPRPGKGEKARREVEKGRRGLPPGDNEVARLLDAALAALAVPEPDEAALERIDAEIEQVLWNRAPEAERRAAEAEVRKELRGRRSAGLEAAVRRKVVKTARDVRKIPHVSLFYY
jgi:hypothetical protein